MVGDMATDNDGRKARAGQKRPGIGGRPRLAAGEKTVSITTDLPESEYNELMKLAGPEMTKAQVARMALRLWVQMQKVRLGIASKE